MRLLIPRAFNFLFQKARFKVSYGGRGAAKSESYARALLTRGMEKKEGILCARELQKSIADSVHALLKHTIEEAPEFNAFYKVIDKEIRGINGTFFIFAGLRHNITEIKSMHGITICWVEEAQVVSDKSWEILIPTIREEDSEIWVSFNTKNPTDPTFQRFVLKQRANSIVRKVGWKDNPFFPKVLEEERLQLLKDDPEAYKHVWDGEFDTRYSGSVYAKYVNQNQISDKIVYNPNIPIYTAWDLGYDDATSVIFYQILLGEIHIIDYYESNFEDIKHYCEQLYGCKITIDERAKDTGKVLKWHFNNCFNDDRANFDYQGGKHWVPHDAGYELQAAQGRSIAEQAGEFDIKLDVIQATNQQSSEQALRKALPKCWFNADKTTDLVHALMHYHYEYDEERKIYGKAPVHDWSSHACDAMELMARMWQETRMTMKDIKIREHDAKVLGTHRRLVTRQADPYRLRQK